MAELKAYIAWPRQMADGSLGMRFAEMTIDDLRDVLYAAWRDIVDDAGEHPGIVKLQSILDDIE